MNYILMQGVQVYFKEDIYMNLFLNLGYLLMDEARVQPRNDYVRLSAAMKHT